MESEDYGDRSQIVGGEGEGKEEKVLVFKICKYFSLKMRYIFYILYC